MCRIAVCSLLAVFVQTCAYETDSDDTMLGKIGKLSMPASRISTFAASPGHPFLSQRSPPQHQSMHRQAAAEAKNAAEPSSHSRRDSLLASTLGLVGAAFTGTPAHAKVSDSKMVGAFLPESTIAPGLYEFVTPKRKTPALRAGNIDPYGFSLPAEWKEQLVANAVSGNYCQPNCDEATVEVQFSDPKQGNLFVSIIPTKKLNLRISNPRIEDIGDPKKVLTAVGPAITKAAPVEPDEVVSAEKMSVDGKTYYLYELETPEALSGLHNLAAVSTNKEYIVLGIVSSSEKQWQKAQNQLREIVKSFRVGLSAPDALYAEAPFSAIRAPALGLVGLCLGSIVAFALLRARRAALGTVEEHLLSVHS
eukprot:gnl/TRDRNA2_/TRDRNA2_85126_c0_seq1.p1 gnl/TRDRNA2_/TRDRNA2_85126_c0~~gnl/TRDRNA2_/TRDRNA2_85126_c0_seq1.p1  ORF type:complete len:364 (+),score=58.51 gnl/TRDRNA2_/TRDRNA2_85126_c0_seq1:95-1186(+)